MFENLRRVEIFAYRPVYLLCGRHHTIVHRDRLTARVTPSGVHWNRIPGSYDTALADTLTDSDLDGPRP